MKLKFGFLTVACSLVVAPPAIGQSALYPHLFDISQVTLLDGELKSAMELNDRVLLDYDAGRLMQPFEKQAGIAESGAPFASWGSNLGGDDWNGYGLDGEIGGHYISALAQSYAAATDSSVKAQLKERLDWCVGRILAAQKAWNESGIDCMKGYCGGVPHSKTMWPDFYNRNTDEYWKSWVPYYNLHKTYNGLRDAWLYAGNEEAKAAFLALCDWGVKITENFTDDEFQNLLNNEPGGMNEPFADAYALTGDRKYLVAAKKYSHRWLLDPMIAGNGEHISDTHSNTQTPKVIGFERIFQTDASASADYGKAAENYWNEVVDNRTLANGGNGTSEWFPAYSDYMKFITSPDGNELCATYNMLKLTELLFTEKPRGKYADYYEKAMLNHVLSAQNPHTGGYVYFTPARPQHYRVYSTINESMWCCVGSGMECYGKYGMFVYSHSADNSNVYVNLFVPSELKSDVASLRQETRFPYAGSSKITVIADGSYTLNIRHPQWADNFSVKVNGSPVSATEKDGYLPVMRSWKAGDVVEVSLPMTVKVNELQGTDYVAFTYGPVLLGAITGTDNLDGQFGHEGRMDQCAPGLQKNLYSAPLLIGPRATLADAVEMTDADKLEFRINGYINDPEWDNLVLEPFTHIHEARYMTYWLNVDGDKWNEIKDELAAQEEAALRLEQRTIDFVDCGVQQSETDHYAEFADFNSKGTYMGEHYRDGAWYTYRMNTNGEYDNVSLMVRYWGQDSGRHFLIKIDGTTIAEVTLTGGKNEFMNVEYPIPSELLKGKDAVIVRFEVCENGWTAGGAYYVRLLRQDPEEAKWEEVKSYLTLTDSFLQVDKWWDNTHHNKVDADAGTIYIHGRPGNHDLGEFFGGQVGWVLPEAFETDEWEKFVVTVQNAGPAQASLNLFQDNASASAFVDVPVADGPVTYTLDLKKLTAGNKTDGAPLTAVNQVYFWGYWGGEVNLGFKEAYFSKKVLKQGAGVEDVALAPVAPVAEGAYDLLGRRYPAEASLAPGIYIINGKKTIVK